MQRLSHLQLAALSGVASNYISDIERGRVGHPNITTLTRLAAALQTTMLDISALFPPAEQVDTPTTWLHALAPLAPALSLADRAYLLALARRLAGFTD